MGDRATILHGFVLKNMRKKTSFDVIVIGTGSAGFSAVEAAVAQGASVCVIERERFGGDCPNSACIPSKAVLRAASVYRQVGSAHDFGVEVAGRSFQWKKVMLYQKGVVETVTGGGEYGDRYVELLKRWRVDWRLGQAVFLDPHTVEVRGETLRAKTFVIATGTVDFIPPIKGLDLVHYWGWKDALQAERQPKSLAIIGGGPVGCELATFYASFGTRVTLLQSRPFVLEREDREISLRAAKALERLGVEIIVDATVAEMVAGHVGVTGLKVISPKREQMVAVEQIVIAAGKRSNTQDLHVEKAGVGLDEGGTLKTNKQLCTNVKHIFGAGDVDGGMLFTHTAHYEGWIAGYNAALVAKRRKGKPIVARQSVVPRVTFIEPEVASVGMTQDEVRAKFGKVLVGRFDVAALGRALTDHKRQGLIKLVAHPRTRKLLGAHMIGERSGEVIHEAALAISLNASIDALANMIHAFPTYSEGLKAAAADAKLEV